MSIEKQPSMMTLAEVATMEILRCEVGSTVHGVGVSVQVLWWEGYGGVERFAGCDCGCSDVVPVSEEFATVRVNSDSRRRCEMERVATIRIGNDEGRFVLVVETDMAEYVFDFHGVALDFAADIRRSGLLRYADEAEDARSSMSRPVTVDDLDGYALDDPKRVELQRMIDRGGV